MVLFKNECCDCAVEAYPCIGSSCSNRHVPHVYCDSCGHEVVHEDLWDDGSGVYMCTACLKTHLQDTGVDIYEEDFEYEDYADAISIDSMIREAE